MTRKLIDDCFRTDVRDGERMSHADTLSLIRDRVGTVVGDGVLEIGDAAGRVAAIDVQAPIDVPGHTNSAVDGYAFCFDHYDAAGGQTFDVSARIAAGVVSEIDVVEGDAARIFTGGVMPATLDTVVMQEDCDVQKSGARVTVPAGLKRGANVRLAGEDVKAGTRIIKRGQVVRAPDVAALSSLGLTTVLCYERPRIGIISTGDEVIRGGGPLKLGQVHDVNTPLLLALARHANCTFDDLGVWPDRLEEVKERLEAASANYDLLITSGGASQGEEDHVSAALAELGARHFWQIAVKPGRPLMLGQIGNTAVVGLPGNPVAVFVCFLIYVWPVIRQLGGATWREPRRFSLPAAFSFENRKVGRREFWRATTRQTMNGMVVEKFARDGSGLISGLRAADGLIDVPEDVPAIAEGQHVDFIPFSEFGILD